MANPSPPNRNVSPPPIPFYVTIKTGHPADENAKVAFDKIEQGYHHRSALDNALTKVGVSAPAWAWVKPTAGEDPKAILFVLGPDGWSEGGAGQIRSGLGSGGQ